MPMQMRDIGPLAPEVARRFDAYVKRMDAERETMKISIERLTNKFMVAEQGLVDIAADDANSWDEARRWAEACLIAARKPNPSRPSIPSEPGVYE